ncbi:hypothetical protein EXIGLDRAFT_213873 [Exidia glandulosa HHB12029]|uniref:Uncharacterized protein n=1 Tax=Exidia glandulosa HHB12029 TaxID=1314781 RepID=A0A165EHJ7_EXIGL|nr:hypothetical protein EXIGLDRAFT_213873 [Exidia glandulosa HHB12029]
MSFRAPLHSLAARGLTRPVRRSYSFFSSKSGAGRYISATKPPKVAAAVAPAAPVNGQQQLDASGASGQEEIDGGAPATAPAPQLASSTAPAEDSAQRRQHPHAHESAPPSTASSTIPHPRPREDLTLNDVRLHAFFAQQRPLLLLPLSSNALFAPPPPPTPAPTPQAPAMRLDGPHISEDPPEASLDSDADANRLLSRTLIMNRVGAWAEWHRVLAELGDEAAVNVQLDSTRRKKRKKMKKHKLAKRRRVRRSFCNTLTA